MSSEEVASVDVAAPAPVATLEETPAASQPAEQQSAGSNAAAPAESTITTATATTATTGTSMHTLIHPDFSGDQHFQRQ
jgi:hypothetical protein